MRTTGYQATKKGQNQQKKIKNIKAKGGESEFQSIQYLRARRSRFEQGFLGTCATHAVVMRPCQVSCAL